MKNTQNKNLWVEPVPGMNIIPDSCNLYPGLAYDMTRADSFGKSARVA